jgi:hypothetical protein
MRRRVSILVTYASAAGLGVLQAGAGAQAATATYYVDCTAGDDSRDGTSPSSAWKTIGKANGAALLPGDSLLFRRGCTWTRSTSGIQFTAKWNGTAAAPITIGAYGVGESPVFRSDAQASSQNQVNVEVPGSYQIIESIHATSVRPYLETTCLQANGQPLPLGWYVGFSVAGRNNTLRQVEADHVSLGVFLQAVGSGNKVLQGSFHDINALWRYVPATPSDAMGGIGVLLQGDDQEAAYLTLERNGVTCTDGNGGVHTYSAPFEVFNANRVFVHHNRAFGHRKHFEMGKDASHTTDDNVLAYNLFVSAEPRAVGPNIHGNDVFGPVSRTQVHNNTVVFTGLNSQGIVCGCTGGATVRNNVFVAEWKAGYYGGTGTEDHNLYWDYGRTADTTPEPYVQFGPGATQTQISPTSLKADPVFLLSDVPGGDYHLGAGSPAIDEAAALGYTADLDGAPVPRGAAPDMGAYEFGPAGFHTLAPCRLLDTRRTAGPLGGPALASGVRAFPIAGVCGVPTSARAVSLNVTVTEPTSPGYVSLAAVGSSEPATSTINYGTGQTRGNNAVVVVNPSGLAAWCSQASGTAHLVVDVNGYFE